MATSNVLLIPIIGMEIRAYIGLGKSQFAKVWQVSSAVRSRHAVIFVNCSLPQYSNTWVDIVFLGQEKDRGFKDCLLLLFTTLKQLGIPSKKAGAPRYS